MVKKHHLISVLWYQEVISVHTGKIAYRSFDKPNKDEKWNTIKNETLFSACLLNLTYFGLVFAQRVFRLVQTRREMSWLLLKIPFFFVAVNEAGNCPEVSWKISSGLTQKCWKCPTVVTGLAASSPLTPTAIHLHLHQRVMRTWCDTFCRNGLQKRFIARSH